MKCFQCKKEFDDNGILIDGDGDFVCSPKCQKDYEREKEYFFNVIVHDEKFCERWLLGKA